MKQPKATLICVMVATISLATAPSFAQNPNRSAEANRARSASRAVARLVANGGGLLLDKELKEASELSPRLARWVKQHREAIIGAGPSPFAKYTKWGAATTRGNKLFLHVAQWPKEGNKLSIPRMHNSVVSVKLGDDELKLKPGVSEWEIELPEKPKGRNALLPVIEMVLDSPAVAGTESVPVVKANEKGAIELHSRYSIVHGKMLRFEPQSYKNTVGYWVNEKDWAEWKCLAPQSGKYEVTLRYGCGNGQGGSDIEISVGDIKLPFKVEATGGFQSWRDVKIGTVELAENKAVGVSAKPVKKAKNAVMDIQQITLTPVD